MNWKETSQEGGPGRGDLSSSSPAPSAGIRVGSVSSRERLASIVTLCSELVHAHSLDEMFAAVMAALTLGTGLERCSLLTVDAGGAMRFRAWRGLSDTYRQRVDGHSPWPATAVDPQEILVADASVHPTTAPLADVFAAEGIAALAFLPLVARGQLLGKFMLYASTPTDWSTMELPFARAVADLVASFLLRENTQQRLLQARKMESLGFLAGGIAHDFNNLLTAMLGYAEMLRAETENGTPAREHAEYLVATVGQASDLTRQLLGFARPKPLHLEIVDLAALVAEATDTLARLVGDRIALRVLGTQAPLPVSANGSQLLQVVRNLVANARDAMPTGGTLTISVARRQAGGKGAPWFVDLAVTDTGVGMDDATRARIFEPLFTTKGSGRGTGLGLSICYGIVTWLGGEIAVSTRLGHGSTFVVSLPMAERLPDRPVRAAAPPVPGRMVARVLLVEDQDDVRNAMAIGLEALGCKVVTAASGGEALEQLAANTVDVVVSDIVMPGMGGIELVERLAQDVPSLPVLLITGYAEAAQDLPPHVPVLQKPFAPADLVRQIAELVPGSGR